MKWFLYLIFFISHIGIAQKLTVKGHLKDTTGTALPSATVMILSAKDSSLVNFGMTAADGAFEIRNLARQEYLLEITYLSYAALMQKISPLAGDQVDVGELRMQPQARQLGEVTVEDDAPVRVKRDTIEFNAKVFKTNENAVVEDLLKKLPGVEVDNDGTIRAQGEQVKRITVDGKEFFGTDPKLATRNLPADAISKVQVFDKKSDQAVFSGVDDGQREKTINLELKEEKRNGAFGTLMGGVGTNDRYQARASLNRFRKQEQLSFLGMANNINEQGFGIDDYMSFTGGSQQMAAGGGGVVRMTIGSNNQSGVSLNQGGRNSGIMTNYAGGINYNKNLTKNTELSTSYFYNHLDHNLLQTTERINFAPSGDLTFNQNSRQNNTNTNHRLNAIIDHKIDSLNSLKFTTNVTYNETDTDETSASENLATDGSLLNDNEKRTIANGTSLTANSALLWRHRFVKKGRTLSVNAQLNVTETDRKGSIDALTNYYTQSEGGVQTLQTNDQTTNTLTYSGTLSYTEPLGGRKYLEANYSYRANLNDVKKNVYDVNSGEPVFNDSLSNLYNSNYQYHRGGLNFRLNRSNYAVTIGAGVQQTFLDGELKLSSATISKSYRNVLPVARFNYDFTSTRHLRFDYETSVTEPTIQQLQPVVDNSDPLNLSVGNPGLRPAYAHNARINYMGFDPASFVNFFGFADITYTKNAITNSQSYTEESVRISKPVNVDNTLHLSGNATFGFPIQKLNSRFSITAMASQQKGVNVIDDLQSTIAQNTIGGRFRYDYRFKEIFDISLGANISRQSTTYKFDAASNQLYYNNTYTAEGNLHLLDNMYLLSSSLEYLTYESKTSDYSQAIPFLIISISRYILKAKSGELKLSVNNVLDQSTGVSQTADVNYFQRQVTNSLGRYYMLTFIYSLNKQLNPMRGMRPTPGGGMRIIRP
jgi:hypothetical protein